MGASFLSAANLTDWIAKNDEEYIQIAVEKSKNRKALWKLKEELRDRLLKNDAWNIKKYTSRRISKYRICAMSSRNYHHI